MPRKISALCCSLVNVNLVNELDLFSSVLLAAAADSSALSLHANGSSFCVDVEAFWSSFFKNPHTDVFFHLSLQHSNASFPGHDSSELALQY